MNRREFAASLVLVSPVAKSLERVMRSSASTSRAPSESLLTTRRSMCDSIRTDPDVARDAVIFVDRWRGELGRIINLGSDLPS